MPEARFGGCAITWRDWHAGAGRQALALHCALAHAGAWSGLAEALPDLHLSAPDLPGHGRSADWDGVSDFHAGLTAMAADFADHLADGQPVELIGHSLGATVALRLALTRPELVRSLTLIEPVLFCAAAQGAVWDGFLNRHHGIADLIASHQLHEAARRFHAEWGGGGHFDDLPERQQSYIAARMPLIVAPDQVLLQDRADLLNRLPQLALPVLLVEGSESPPIIAAVMAGLAGRLPNVRRHRVAGAGHMAPISHPGAVAAALRAFWQA